MCLLGPTARGEDRKADSFACRPKTLKCRGKAKNGGMAEGQSLFVLELMQLYVLACP